MRLVEELENRFNRLEEKMSADQYFKYIRDSIKTIKNTNDLINVMATDENKTVIEKNKEYYKKVANTKFKGDFVKFKKWCEKQINEFENNYFSENIEEMNVTANMDGGSGPPKTPGSFSKTGKEDENDNAEKLGYKKVKPIRRNFESSFKKLANQMYNLNEVSYHDYRNDETQTSTQKINNSIKEINRKIYEVERIINRNVKLKKEMGVTNLDFWKPTSGKIRKISERLLRISRQLRELNA